MPPFFLYTSLFCLNPAKATLLCRRDFKKLWLVILLTYSIKNLAQKPRTFGFVENFILLGFFINLLPFIGIGRVMFLYHYFSSLIFSILALAYFGNKKSVFAFLTIVSTVGFLYFTPLTYGLPILPQHEANFFWLPSWR